MRFKLWIFGLIISILSISCAPEKAVEENPINNKKVLLEAVSKFNNAFRTCNIEVLDSMLTSNYQHTNGNSKSFGKSDWLNYLKKRKQDLEEGNLTISHYAMSETEIEMFDNSAIVTARIIVDSQKNGELHENEYRVTNFWVIENGRWKRAGFHDGRIK